MSESYQTLKEKRAKKILETGCAGVTHAGPHPTIVREGRLLSLQYLRQQILPRGPEPDEPGGRQDDVQHTPRKHP